MYIFYNIIAKYTAVTAEASEIDCSRISRFIADIVDIIVLEYHILGGVGQCTVRSGMHLVMSYIKTDAGCVECPVIYTLCLSEVVDKVIRNP